MLHSYSSSLQYPLSPSSRTTVFNCCCHPSRGIRTSLKHTFEGGSHSACELVDTALPTVIDGQAEWVDGCPTTPTPTR